MHRRTLIATLAILGAFTGLAPLTQAQTEIRYALPHATNVDLTLWNVQGQLVRSLVAEHQAAGWHSVTWDGRDGNGKSMASGIYYYRLETPEFTRTRRLVLIK